MRILKNKPDTYPRGEYLKAMDKTLDAYIKKHCPRTAVDG